MPKRLDSRDLQKAAESINEDFKRRKKNREDLEKQWDEVDRQVELRARPKDPEAPAWRSNVELSLQAEALEILTADSRRLRFPDDYNWFSVHAEMTDENLANLESKGLISGDESEQQAKIGQTDLDALVEAVMIHNHKKYDLRGHIDAMDAEAFKYGTYSGRIRKARTDKFTKDFRGVSAKSEEIPILFPVSIRNLYLDDSMHFLHQEGMLVGSSYIREYWQNLEDLKKAAKKGGSDRGWITGQVKTLEPGKDKESIHLMEFEGDLLIPRSQDSIFKPNVIVTVGKGANLKVIRIRDIEEPFRTYVTGTYHIEGANKAYGTSPLLKGMPVQKMATLAGNRLMDAATLNASPPIRYSPTDQYMAASGGPRIEPDAVWRAAEGTEPQDIGDPTALFQVYLGMLQQYATVTGITAPRSGQQTKSHQTAFAIDAEMGRSQVRTVDYVRTSSLGPLLSFLYMEYEMLKKMPEQSVWVPRLGGYVTIKGSDLPERVEFEIQGSAGPLKDREKEQKQFAAFQFGLQIEPLARQLGFSPLNLDAVRKEIWQMAGVLDIDRFFTSQAGGAAEAPPGGAVVSGTPDAFTPPSG